MIRFRLVFVESREIVASCQTYERAWEDKLFFEELYEAKIEIVEQETTQDNRW